MDQSVFKNKPFLFILFTAFLSIMGIGIIIPVVPYIVGKYVDQHKINDIALYVGLLTSLYSFCQFFAAPVLGALSDKYGRRPIILICLIGSAIGYILFGIGGSLTILFVSRIIDGITGGDISTAFAYVADVTKPQDRGKYFGVIGATVGFGFIIAPTIGGLLSTISLSAPLYAAAGLTILNALYGYFILPESLAKNDRMTDFTLDHLNPFKQIATILKNSLIKSILITGFFYFLAFAQIQSITTVFFKDTLGWTPANLGLFFLVLGLGDMFTQGFLVGKLTPKFGVLKLVFAGFVITGIAYMINAILGVYTFVGLAFLFIVIYALGSGLFEPSYGGLLSSAASPHEQGRVQGASQSIQSITRIIGPLIAAGLYQYHHSLPWISCVIFSLAGIYLLNRHKKELHRHAHV